MMGNISNISFTLYKSLGLPAPKPGHKLRADHNELTQKVDGNIDGNDKNGFVETEELYEEVFNNRSKYQLVIEKLYEAGLEDPFEERPEIKAYVEKLFKIHKPRTEEQKAILLFRVVIPEDRRFRFFPPLSVFSSLSGTSGYHTSFYQGLSRQDGGLAVSYNRDSNIPLKIRFGDPLPKELINSQNRATVCIGYGNLLICLLRAAGIKAHIKEMSNHVFVIAIINKYKNKLDITKNMYIRTWQDFDTDREGIAFHYLQEGAILSKQGKYDKALGAYKTALELKPKFARVWHNIGLVLCKQKKLDEALAAFDESTKINPRLAQPWHNKGVVLSIQGKLPEALAALNEALKINPKHAMAWKVKSKVLLELGRSKESSEAFEKYKALENLLAKK